MSENALQLCYAHRQSSTATHVITHKDGTITWDSQTFASRWGKRIRFLGLFWDLANLFLLMKTMILDCYLKEHHTNCRN